MLRVLLLYSGIGGMHCALLHARELRRLRLLGLFPSSLPSQTPDTTPSKAKATAAASAASATAAPTDGHVAAAANSNDGVSDAEGAARPAASPPKDIVGEAEIAAAAAFPVAPAAAAQAATGGEGGAAEAKIAAAEAYPGVAAEEVLPLTPQFLRELAGYALDGDSYCIHPLIAKHMKKLVTCAAGSRSYSTAAAAGYNAAPALAATSDTAAAMSTARDWAVSCPAASAVAGGARVSATAPAACSACACASAARAASASAAVACPSAPAALGRTRATFSPAAAAAADDHFLSVAVVGAIDVNPTAMEVYRWNFVTSELAYAAAFPSSTPASAVAAVPTGTSTSAGGDAQHRLKRRQQQHTRDQQEEQQAPLSSEQQLCYQQKAQDAHKHLVASPAAAALRADACASAVAVLDTPATQAASASTAAAAAAGCLAAEEARTAQRGAGAGSGGCAFPDNARGGSSAAVKLQSNKTVSPAGSGVVMIEGRRAAVVADDNQGAAVASGERQSGSTAATYESLPGELKKHEAWKASPTKRAGDGGVAEAAQERTPAGLAAPLEHGGKTGKREGKGRGTESRGLYSSSSSSNRISRSGTDTTTSGSPYLSTRSISSFSAVEWCHFAADLWLISPPCQPFTRSGFRKGNADARTSSLLQLLRALCEMERELQPKYLLLENVVGFESSDTFASLLHALRCRCCYDVKVFHLNPLHFGIPNCRSRCFITAVKRRSGTAVSAALQAGDEGGAEKQRGIAEAVPAAGRPGSAAPPAEAPEAAAGESPAAAGEEEEENKRATSATVQEEAASVEGTMAADTRTAATAVPDDEAAEQKAQEAAATAREEAFAGGIGDVAERNITAAAREMTHAASLRAPAPTTGAIQDEGETNFEARTGTHTEPEAARSGRRNSSCCNTSSITGDLVRAPASLSARRQQKRSAVSRKSRAATPAVSGDPQGTTTAAKEAAAVTGTEEEKGSSSCSTELFPLWDEDCVRCRRTLAAGVEVLPFIPGLYQQPLFFCCPIRPLDHFLEEDIPPKRNRSPSAATASFSAPSSSAATPSARPSATDSTGAAPAGEIHAAAASSLTAPAATATSLPTAAASATAAASPVAAVCSASARAGDTCFGAPTAAAVPPAAPHAADFSLSAGTVAKDGGDAAGRLTCTSHRPAAAGADCAGVAAPESPVFVDVDAAGERQLLEPRAQCATPAAETSGEHGEREAGTPEAESKSGSEDVDREPSLSMEHKKSIWCQVDLVRKTDKRSCCFTRSYGRSGRAQYGSLLLLNDDLQLEERWTAFAENQQRQQTIVTQQQHQAEKQERQREHGEEKEQQHRYTEGKQEQQEAEERQGCHQGQPEQRPTHERQRSEQHWLQQEDKTYRLHKEKQEQRRAEHSRWPRKGWELHDVLAPEDVDVRFFSVREMLSLHGFPAIFAFPPRPANAPPTKDFTAGPSAPPVSWTQQQRRLVGNSLNVYVVAMLIDYLIDDTDWQ